MIDYTIVLQAGGRSERMGTDKALVPFMGTTMLGYIRDQIAAWGRGMLVISRTPEKFGSFGLPVYSDVIPDWGALGGLHAALVHAPTEWSLVLACDMPFIRRSLIDHMSDLAEGHEAVIPRLSSTGFTEPFRAFYKKSCLPSIEAAIAKGDRRVDSFFPHVAVRFIEEAEIAIHDPDLRSFFNVNTPEDLAQAAALARAEQGKS